MSLTDPSVLGDGDSAKLEMKVPPPALPRLSSSILFLIIFDTCAQLIADKEKKTLTLIDRGCGMSKEDLINQLGERLPFARRPIQ